MGDKLIVPSFPPQLVAGFANSAGNLKGDSVYLREKGNAAGTPPSTGLTAVAGRHTFDPDIEVQQNSMAGTKVGEFRVYDITATGAPVLLAKYDLNGSAQHNYSGVGRRITVDVGAGVRLQAVAVFTVTGTGGSDKIWVYNIRHWFQRTVGDGTSSLRARWDPADGVRQYVATSADLVVDNLFPLGAPILIPPGWSLLVVDQWDAADLGYQKMNAWGDALAKHTYNRKGTVRVIVHPLFGPE
jgi:hypothetical protein